MSYTVLDALNLLLPTFGIDRPSPNILANDQEMTLVRTAMDIAGSALCAFPWPQLREEVPVADGNNYVQLPDVWNGVPGQVIVLNGGRIAEYEPDEALFLQQASSTNWPMYRIAGNVLHLHPAADNARIFVQTMRWISAGTRIQSNSDMIYLPQPVFLLRTQVEWLRQKGMPHQSELSELTELISTYLRPHVAEARDASHAAEPRNNSV